MKHDLVCGFFKEESEKGKSLPLLISTFSTALPVVPYY